MLRYVQFNEDGDVHGYKFIAVHDQLSTYQRPNPTLELDFTLHDRETAVVLKDATVQHYIVCTQPHGSAG